MRHGLDTPGKSQADPINHGENNSYQKKNKMSEIKKNISPGKKYVLRVLDLAKKDPSIGNLMPDPTVYDAAAEEGLSQDKVIDAILEGYADRPALGERTYVAHNDEASGEVSRQYQMDFNTITYRAFQEKIKAANTSAMPCWWR